MCNTYFKPAFNSSGTSIWRQCGSDHNRMMTSTTPTYHPLVWQIGKSPPADCLDPGGTIGGCWKVTEPPHPLQNESLLNIKLICRRVVRTMSVAYEGWLPALVNSQNFFTPCTRCSGHHSARESSLNFWDIDNKEELCSICLQNEPREHVLQVGVV